MTVLILRSSQQQEQALTGLDWDGSGDERRMLVFTSPPPIYPLTFVWKVFPRNQVETRPDGNRYFTAFFWGNNGTFFWNTGGPAPSFDTGTYYGCHPYPTPNPDGDGKWEISVYGGDFVTRDDTSAPFVTWDQWYSQAFVATRASVFDTNHKYWIALPSTSSANTITKNITGDGNWADEDPPDPCICWGQAPDDGTGHSWGGYDGWEEFNWIIRGVQIYTEGLSQAAVVALGACETDAEVLAECSSRGITSLWYLNMNPTPTDVQDKSGNGHHPTWEGSARPTLWTE